MLPQPPEGARIYIRPGRTDMRKSINGLSAMVEQHFQMNPYEDGIFAFCNGAREIVKILWWDRNGFVVLHKRLEKDRFPWPDTEAEALELSSEQLGWLLNGIDFRKEHKAIKYSRAS